MKNKKISLLEFRAWLGGVEELQPNDWVPTGEQWKLIRKKIDTIESQPTAGRTYTPVQPAPTYSRPPTSFIPPPPPPVGGLPLGVVLVPGSSKDAPPALPTDGGGSSFE